MGGYIKPFNVNKKIDSKEESFVINGNLYKFTLEGNDYISNTFYDKEDAMLVRLIKDLKTNNILYSKKMRPTGGGKTVRVAVTKDDLKNFKKSL